MERSNADGTKWDLLLYKRLEGSLSVKGKKIEFGFDIETYQELMAYVISVQADSEGVSVQVTDPDFTFKSFYFQTFA